MISKEHVRRTLYEKALLIMQEEDDKIMTLSEMKDSLVLAANENGGEKAFWKAILGTAKSWLREHPIHECAELLANKNAVYGSESLILTGCRGIAIRCLDKVCRMQYLLGGVRSEEYNVESYDDSVMDLVNYAVLSLLLLEDQL